MNTLTIGIIETVGHGMDLYLTCVRTTQSNGLVTNSDMIFVMGSNIRYVHLPPSINMTSHLAEFMSNTESLSYKNKPRKIVERKRKIADASS
jgi:hypothetical protein